MPEVDKSKKNGISTLFRTEEHEQIKAMSLSSRTGDGGVEQEGQETVAFHCKSFGII